MEFPGPRETYRPSRGHSRGRGGAGGGEPLCADGRRCSDEHCARGRHPPLCHNGFYCPDKSTSCRFRHFAYDNSLNEMASKRNKGLLILVEMDHLLIHEPAGADGALCASRGAFDFIRWLKTKCQRAFHIRAAFCTRLPQPAAQLLASALDPDGALFIFADGYSKRDPSTGHGHGAEATMLDLPAVWASQGTPAEQHCPYSTIVVDNNVRRAREYPNNLVFVPPFGYGSAEEADRFDLRSVQQYLDVVIGEWLQRPRAKLVHRDIRQMLRQHLDPAVRREPKLLILLDLNGTLMYRTMEKLQTEAQFYRVREDQRYYYYRPRAREFVSFLIEKMETSDCVDIAFYSSMTGKNATAAAANLDPTCRLHVYAREFNQPDTSGESQWAVIRDLRAVWASPGRPGFQHSARSTIMIDDTCRKLREYPDNLVQVPEYTAECVERGEGFSLDLLMAHIGEILNVWQTDYSLARDIRQLLVPLNQQFYVKCSDADKHHCPSDTISVAWTDLPPPGNESHSWAPDY